jgi:hypothetical protein
VSKKDSALAEIRRANELFAAHGRMLLADPEISALLRAYRAQIDKTGAAMAEAGVVSRCADCAGADHISCCFDGAEYWFDHRLLLINLLMGAELPRQRAVEGQCLFVGPQGCRLVARFAICINFFCPDLRAYLGPDTLTRLRKQGGDEVLAGLELEQALTRWLGRHSG